MAIALAVTLGGCISLAPHYARPAMPVPNAWPADAPDAPDRSATAAPPDWREYFTDATLQRLVGKALENNRDLRIALARVEEARASYGLQRSAQFPTIAASASFLRFRTPGGLLMPNSMTGSLVNAGFAETSWELDFWGRVRNLKEAALDEFLASDDARRAVTVSLIEQVADAYLRLCEYDERIALTRATVESRAESLRIFRHRYEVGAISRLDLTQSETLLEQAQMLAAQLEQARASEAHALAILVGTDGVEREPRVPGRLDDAGAMREISAGLPSDLLTRRPDIVAAERRLRAAHANIGAARAAFFPRITLTSSIGTGSTSLDGLFRSGTGSWAFLPNLSLPIFDGGRNISNLDLAKARRDEALAQYEKTIESAFRDVSDALSAKQWLAAQVESARGIVATQSERARLAKLRYDSGATPFLEVLDAQRDLLNAQQQLIQMRRALLSSRVALYAALGGGATATAPEHAQTAAARSPATSDTPLP
ncbi:outer membrane efflux protein [Trinickia caryophylli]|nr:outer membrane efflux protein [Trinickia caryophylli]